MADGDAEIIVFPFGESCLTQVEQSLAGLALTGHNLHDLPAHQIKFPYGERDILVAKAIAVQFMVKDARQHLPPQSESLQKLEMGAQTELSLLNDSEKARVIAEMARLKLSEEHFNRRAD